MKWAVVKVKLGGKLTTKEIMEKYGIKFYIGLGLPLDHTVDGKIAFLWIVEEQS
ncbi:hypothetical protein [Exiguobacterium artemiae]|uniref:hypothetical protein n=1 Tax=Exiguobacterium artemiae TaxID=340145 RepID=UPI003D06DFAD